MKFPHFLFIFLLLLAAPLHAERVTNLQVLERGNDHLIFSWDSSVAEDSFEVRVQENEGPWNPRGMQQDRQFLMQRLVTGHRYRIKVRAESGGGWVESLPSRTVLPAPEAVSGVSLQGSGHNRLQLRWQTTSSLLTDGFELRYRKAGAPQWQPLKSLGKEATEYALDGLLAATSYEVAIRSVNHDKTSSWVSQTLRTSLAPATTPRLKVISSEQMNISWDVTAAPTRVSFRQSQQNWATAVVDSESHHVLRRLQPESWYDVRIQHQINGEWTPWSPIARARTMALLIPAVLTRPTASHISETNTKLLWSAKDNHGEVDSYTLSWRPLKGDWNEINNISQASHELLNLMPGQEYEARIRAVKADRAGEWSNILSWTTVQPSIEVPVIGNFYNISHSAIGLRWKAEDISKDNDAAFQIEYREMNGNWLTLDKMLILNPYRLIIDLKPATTYEFRVRLIKGQRQSQWSAIKQAKTLDLPKRVFRRSGRP